MAKITHGFANILQGGLDLLPLSEALQLEPREPLCILGHLGHLVPRVLLPPLLDLGEDLILDLDGKGFESRRLHVQGVDVGPVWTRQHRQGRVLQYLMAVLFVRR